MILTSARGVRKRIARIGRELEGTATAMIPAATAGSVRK
jgi:hypothetical protein